jgi:RNA polymerase sigma-70 factor (ECF subfamily)
VIPQSRKIDPDQAWVSLAQEKNPQAIKALYEKYFLPIYRFLFWQTGDEAVAEDLTQETFLGMVKGITKFKHKALFRNWLYQIAKYQLASWIKQKSFQAESFWLDEVIAVEPDSWIDPEAQIQQLAKLKRLLAILSKSERQVLELRFLRAQSVAETAIKLKLSISNVKVLTYRSLAKLRKQASL